MTQQLGAPTWGSIPSTYIVTPLQIQLLAPLATPPEGASDMVFRLLRATGRHACGA